MPEGDTIAVAADALRQRLRGATITGVGGHHRAMIASGKRLHGAAVDDVVSRGKHLLIHFDNRWSLRVHLGMTGSWHLYRPGERWGTEAGRARVVLETDEAIAVCFSAPTVSVGPTPRIEDEIDHLGPDLMGDGVDFGEVVRRATASEAATVADLLLDQRVAAGIGNVYKSEICFLERVHPSTDPTTLEPQRIERLFERGRRLLLANRRPGARSTTGYRDRDHWVYDCRGRPCSRCGSVIESGELGNPPRVTYWCPDCSPPPGL